MEFDACSYYQQNAQRLKIRESTTYGIHIDEESNVIVSCTDFGHIHLYHHEIRENGPNSGCNGSSASLNGFNKKTLHTDNPPIFASQLSTFSNSRILFCGGRNNSLRGYLWETVMSVGHNSSISADFEFLDSSDRGNIISIESAPKVKNTFLTATNRN
jgi:hypothetical protein